MKHTTALAAIALAALQAEAQVSWTANLSNPDFPTSSGTITATVPANPALDPYVYFSTTLVNPPTINYIGIQGETGGTVSVPYQPETKWPIAAWPSGNLYGYKAEVSWNSDYNFLRGNFMAVPEPSTYALFAGIGLCAFAVWRRRGV